MNPVNISAFSVGTSWLLSILLALQLVAQTAWCRPSSTGTYRYVPNRHNFGAFLDGGGLTAQLSSSASTFLANQKPGRAFNRRDTEAVGALVERLPALPDPQGGTSGVTLPELPDLSNEGGTELQARPGASKGGKFARKNCFFSPLQCSFYYIKRSPHHRQHNADTADLLITTIY